MTIAHTRFQIVVGVERSEHADAVLRFAFDQAVRHEHPTLHFVAVVSDAAGEADAGEALVGEVREALDDAVAAELRVDWTLLCHVRRGKVEEELTDLAAEVHADLIVVGRFGIARHRRGAASVADRVVALADCPVLVVTPPRDTTESDRQCVACVDVRRQTGGEQWFCDRHHGEWTEHLTLSSPPTGRGGAMW